MVKLNPLVAPGPELSASDRERFARHMPIPELGEEAQRRLRAAKVCVVGAGGLVCASYCSSRRSTSRSTGANASSSTLAGARAAGSPGSGFFHGTM